MMKAITIVCGSMIALGVIMQLNAEASKPIEVTSDFETDKLKSRWFWLDSEVTAAKELSGKQFYQGLRNEVESELKLRKNVCVRKTYMQGTLWESCDIHASSTN
ncbi:hypothetical protein D3C87_588200 [compost metagenome]